MQPSKIIHGPSPLSPTSFDFPYYSLMLFLLSFYLILHSSSSPNPPFFHSVRESATSVVITFITTYPLGAKRLAAHLKQMITNCAYTYDDGRLSSFEALETLVRLLPLPVLEDNAQSIFLPMALRLVSEVSAASKTDYIRSPLLA